MMRFSSWGVARTLPAASRIVDCCDSGEAVNSPGRSSNILTPEVAALPVAPTAGISRSGRQQAHDHRRGDEGSEQADDITEVGGASMHGHRVTAEPVRARIARPAAGELRGPCRDRRFWPGLTIG